MEEPNDPLANQSNGADADADRRAFIQKAGKFALVAPPVITALLTTSLASDAIAKSGQSSRQVLPRGYEKP